MEICNKNREKFLASQVASVGKGSKLTLSLLYQIWKSEKRGRGGGVVDDKESIDYIMQTEKATNLKPGVNPFSSHMWPDFVSNCFRAVGFVC